MGGMFQGNSNREFDMNGLFRVLNVYMREVGCNMGLLRRALIRRINGGEVNVVFNLFLLNILKLFFVRIFCTRGSYTRGS